MPTTAGILTVFRSDTTLRSHLVRPKDTVDLVKQDGVVYKIPCECGKVYIGETGRSIHERIKEYNRDAAGSNPILCRFRTQQCNGTLSALG